MEANPLLSRSTQHSSITQPLTLHFSAMGRDFQLALWPSQLTARVKINGAELRSLPELFQGNVVGDPGSWVRISIENGKPTGYLFTSGQLLRLDLAQRIPEFIANHGSNLLSEWVMFESSAADDLPLFVRRVDQTYFAPPARANPNLNTSTRNTLQRLTTHNTTRAMRIGIVIDSRFNEHHNGRGLAQALSIMNGVDAIYQQQLGVALILDRIRVFEDAATDPTRHLSGSTEQKLAAFRDIRLADAHLPNDLALVHWFSGHSDPDNLIGLGWIGSVCRTDGYDVSVSTPFSFDMLLAAHEIAHNLGALHDDDPICERLVDHDDSSIMWSLMSSRTNTTFSRCSLQHMQPSLSASCNIENINVGITLDAQPASDTLQRLIGVHITNHDNYRSASNILSKTSFPDSTILAQIPAGCELVTGTLLCVHEFIPAQSTDTIQVLATLNGYQYQQVTTHLQLNTFVDVDALDNRASLDVLLYDAASGQALTAASTELAAQYDASVDGATAVAAIRAKELLTLLLALSGLLLRRPPGKHSYDLR